MMHKTAGPGPDTCIFSTGVEILNAVLFVTFFLDFLALLFAGEKEK